MKNNIITTLVLFALCTFLACKQENKKVETNQFLPKVGDKIIDDLTIQIDQDPLNADLRYKRALRLYEKKMLDECIEDMRVAITTDSLNAEYYHLVSDAFLDNNLSSKALQSMEKVVALYPTKISSLLKLAETQFILKQYEPALITCNSIVKIDPQNAEAYFMLGSILKDMGESQRAINAFQTATEMDSKLIDAWISIGNIYSEKKDNKALTYYENAINIDPKNLTAKHALAYHYQQVNQVQKAISIYDEIITLDPKYKDAFLNAGILQLENRNLDKAFEYFNILISVDSKDWTGYHYRGIINMEKNKFKEAIVDFKNSKNLNKENIKADELIKYCEGKI
jgi:tetratricopeptide (TPR) repeat protein